MTRTGEREIGAVSYAMYVIGVSVIAGYPQDKR